MDTKEAIKQIIQEFESDITTECWRCEEFKSNGNKIDCTGCHIRQEIIAVKALREILKEY